MSIIEAGKAIKDFLEKNLDREAKLLKTVKTEEGWTGEAEVFEDSAFIKSLGLPTKIQDRNLYEVKLTNELEVVAFEQVNDREDK